MDRNSIGSGRFKKFLEGFGMFKKVLEDFGRFWTVVEGSCKKHERKTSKARWAETGTRIAAG